MDALLQPLLDTRPTVCRHDARNDVEWKDFLRASIVAIDRKRDALIQERQLGISLNCLNRVDASIFDE